MSTKQIFEDNESIFQKSIEVCDLEVMFAHYNMYGYIYIDCVS